MTWIRRTFWLLVAFAAAQACTLNPQPIPPGATGADAGMAAPPIATTDPDGNAGVSDASGGLKEGGSNGSDAGTAPNFDGGDATTDGDPDGGDGGDASDASDDASDAD